jgi:predicted transglutaminase-like cysteine proteinase
MSIVRTQKKLNQRFVYQSDDGEQWNVLTAKSPDKLLGDCEDYSLTLAWMLSGESMLKMWFNILTLKFIIWHCKSPAGTGHAIMWIRGHGWTDNIQRKVVTRKTIKNMGYRLKFPYVGPLALFKYYVSAII